MTEPTDIRVGDWVRFYQNGDLVIGVVQYIRRNEFPRDPKPTALTDIGAIEFHYIVECRRAVAPRGDASQ